MVFSSPWLTAKKESGSPLQTALVCNSNPLMVARLPKTGCSPYYSVYEELASPEQTATACVIAAVTLYLLVFMMLLWLSFLLDALFLLVAMDYAGGYVFLLYDTAGWSVSTGRFLLVVPQFLLVVSNHAGKIMYLLMNSMC
nr:hypothetical protein [Tanacetum cinerariifolium]